MKTAFVINNNRMAPCFAGNELWIYSSSADLDKHEVIDTSGWEMRDWVTNLHRSDVEKLLCAGIDNFLHGALCGNGVVVISDVAGTLDVIFDKWKSGSISEPEYYGGQGRHCGYGRKQCRKGKNRNRGAGFAFQKLSKVI
jgi:hypothetical protein